MKYDVIIIGAGASGLFAAANTKLSKNQNGLIINKASRPGIKLLMSGSGQCNLTHAGDIRDYINHYGPSGKRIRQLLYGFTNIDTMKWFTERGVPLLTREDGKVFPKSLSSSDVLDVLLNQASLNGFTILNDTSVNRITESLTIYTTNNNGRTEQFSCSKLILACGGASYPSSGSDGSILPVLSKLGLEINPIHPSLVPINTESYPYAEISGSSVKSASVCIFKGNDRPKNAHSLTDDILFTHRNFSGPAILNMSRYATAGMKMEINWLPEISPEIILNKLNANRNGNKKTAVNALRDNMKEYGLPDSFLTVLLSRSEIDKKLRYSDMTSVQLKRFIKLLCSDQYLISGTGGWNTAMATAGGVSLNDINMKTMQSNNNPNMYLIGEMLDIDGDTGGYNLQFGFSSAYAAAQHLSLVLQQLL